MPDRRLIEVETIEDQGCQLKVVWTRADVLVTYKFIFIRVKIAMKMLYVILPSHGLRGGASWL